MLNERRCFKCGRGEGYTALHRHHKLKRSKGGDDTDLVDLCPTCHRWVEEHPLLARGLGLYEDGYKFSKNKQ